MDFPGAHELAQGLALELAALMGKLELIYRYLGAIAAIALTIYLTGVVWRRLKQLQRRSRH